MEEIFRLGAIHRICIRKVYKSYRSFCKAKTDEERAFWRGMCCAYDYISSCFTRRLGDVLTESYPHYGKSK